MTVNEQKTSNLIIGVPLCVHRCIVGRGGLT